MRLHNNKKSICIIIALCLFAITTACTSNEPVSVFDFSDSTHIGYSFEKYCERTKLSQDIFTCLDEHNYFYVADTVTFDEVDFHKYLMFGYDNALYGFGYGSRISDVDKAELGVLISDLYDIFVKNYGEPTTYPGIPNRISTIEDYSDVTSGYDEWNFMDGNPMCDLILSFTTTPDNMIEIDIRYKVANIRNGQQIVQEYIKE